MNEMTQEMPTIDINPLPMDDRHDIACILEFTSDNKEEFDIYILNAFQKHNMPLVKCSRKSRVDLIDGQVVKEICTQKYRCDLGGRPTPKKIGVKTRRSKSKRLDCPFSFNATMLKTTRVWSITDESKRKLLAHWVEMNHGHCHLLDDQELRIRRLQPHEEMIENVSQRIYLEETMKSNDSIQYLMEQSSSIVSALMKAEAFESTSKNETTRDAVKDHIHTLRLSLDQVTAKIKLHHT